MCVCACVCVCVCVCTCVCACACACACLIVFTCTSGQAGMHVSVHTYTKFHVSTVLWRVNNNTCTKKVTCWPFLLVQCTCVGVQYCLGTGIVWSGGVMLLKCTLVHCGPISACSQDWEGLFLHCEYFYIRHFECIVWMWSYIC